MKVISWNVEGRVPTTLDRQLEALLDRGPDVIALQELTLATLPIWEQGLTESDYSVLSTVDLVSVPYPEPPYGSPPYPPPRGEIHDHVQRKYFNLTASRYPLEPLLGLSFDDSEEERLAFPEKFLATLRPDGWHQRWPHISTLEHPGRRALPAMSGRGSATGHMSFPFEESARGREPPSSLAGSAKSEDAWRSPVRKLSR